MPIIVNGKTVAGIYHAGHRTLDPTGAVPTGKVLPTPAHRADFSPETQNVTLWKRDAANVVPLFDA